MLFCLTFLTGRKKKQQQRLQQLQSLKQVLSKLQQKFLHLPITLKARTVLLKNASTVHITFAANL